LLNRNIRFFTVHSKFSKIPPLTSVQLAIFYEVRVLFEFMLMFQ